VASYLVSQGIISGRLMVTGYGETQPVASNATAAGKSQNRRVEIQIAPFTG
jgi:outer membrane protein OmpA-like peptidoglycan-associated protein